MPGVGVAPGLNGFFSSASLGMPGVGVVPLVIALTFVGIPGVCAFDISTGLAESPAGKFALSSVTAMLAFVLVFAEFAEFVDAVPPQAIDKTTEIKNTKSERIFCINFKNNVPIWRLRPNEGSDGGQTGTGRSIYSNATVREQPLKEELYSRLRICQYIVTRRPPPDSCLTKQIAILKLINSLLAKGPGSSVGRAAD